MKIYPVLWYEYILFKNKFWNITFQLMVGPFLYLIAFGWGLGGLNIGDTPYIDFVIPGIIAMSTMMTCFNTMAFNINIARTYDKTFEEFMTAPIDMKSYAFGEILAYALRGMYSASIIIGLCLVFQTGFKIDFYMIMIIILNCLVFSSLGFMIGMLIEAHSDVGKFQNFIITPMSFLCGTFFPLEKMPALLKYIIWILPLSQTSIAMRRNSPLYLNSWIHPLILLIYFIAITYAGIKLCKKAE